MEDEETIGSDDVGAVPPADFLARLDRVEHDDEVQQRLNQEMEAFQHRLLQQSWDLQSTFSKPLNLEKHFVPPEPRQLSRSQTPPTSSVSGPGQAAFSDMRATEAALQQEQQELQQQLEEAARARHRGPATAVPDSPVSRAARLARVAMAPLGLAELPLQAMPTTAARAGSEAAPREAPNAGRPLSPRSFSYPRAPSVRSEHEAQRDASGASRPLSPRVPRASPLRSREAAAHDRRGSPRRAASPLAGAAGDCGGGGGGGDSAGNGDVLVEDAVRATSARRQKGLPPRATPSAT